MFLMSHCLSVVPKKDAVMAGASLRLLGRPSSWELCLAFLISFVCFYITLACGLASLALSEAWIRLCFSAWLSRDSCVSISYASGFRRLA